MRINAIDMDIHDGGVKNIFREEEMRFEADSDNPTIHTCFFPSKWNFSMGLRPEFCSDHP